MLIEFLNDTGSDKVLKVISGKYPEIPYNKLNSLLRKKDIRVNGRKINENIEVLNDDMIQFFIPSLEDVSQSRSINIFYRDKNILIAEKPQEIEVEGASSLTEILSAGEKYLKACHRLDRNTTGLVVFALNEAAYLQLFKAFSQRAVDKYYLALLCGSLENKSAALDAFLFKDSKKSHVYISDTSDKGYSPVSLEYNVIEEFCDLSLTEIKLITGKTHQIRAQFAHIGHPVLGDGKYGKNELNKQYDARCQQLYAYRLKFSFEENSPLSYLNNMDFTNSLYLSDLREFNPDYKPDGFSEVIKNYDIQKDVDEDSFPPYEDFKAAMESAKEKEELQRVDLSSAQAYFEQKASGVFSKNRQNQEGAQSQKQSRTRQDSDSRQDRQNSNERSRRTDSFRRGDRNNKQDWQREKSEQQQRPANDKSAAAEGQKSFSKSRRRRKKRSGGQNTGTQNTSGQNSGIQNKSGQNTSRQNSGVQNTNTSSGIAQPQNGAGKAKTADNRQNADRRPKSSRNAGRQRQDSGQGNNRLFPRGKEGSDNSGGKAED